MAREIFRELFKFYKVNQYKEKDKRAMRKTIKTRLKKHYGNKTWEELSELEQQTFKLVQIKDYLLKKTSTSKREEVKKKIEKELEETLYAVNKELQEHANKKQLIDKQFYNPSASDDENKRAYKEFLSLVPQYVPLELAPSYDEWVSMEQPAANGNPPHHPSTLRDLQLEYQSSLYGIAYEANNEHQGITQAEVDHIILECIRKYLAEANGILIDEEEIKRCLRQKHTFEMIGMEELQTEIDFKSQKSKEKQNELIRNNKEMVNAILKIEKLDFLSFNE